MTYQPTGLAERAATFGHHTLTDHEALELYLARSLKQGAKTYADLLLRRFTGLGEVLGADRSALAGIVGAEAAADLKLMHDVHVRALAAPLRRRNVISSWSVLADYVKATLQGASREQFRVIFLDKKNQVIEDRLMAEGTVDHAPVYPREVVRSALERDASAIILVHNHPSGDPNPSSADVAMTAEIVQACKPLRVAVHDHLIVGRDGLASLKALGLM